MEIEPTFPARFATRLLDLLRAKRRFSNELSELRKRVE